MTKNILKKFYLTDEYEDEESYVKEELDSNKNNDYIKEDSDSDNDSEFLEIDTENEIPKIEFIVEEDENKQKQIRMNFEFKMSSSNEVVKIDLEISKNTYLEIADELLK